MINGILATNARKKHNMTPQSVFSICHMTERPPANTYGVQYIISNGLLLNEAPSTAFMLALNPLKSSMEKQPMHKVSSQRQSINILLGWPILIVIHTGNWYIEYKPWIICTRPTLLCFVIIRGWQILPISFRAASLALGQSYDCPRASEATLWWI